MRKSPPYAPSTTRRTPDEACCPQHQLPPRLPAVSACRLLICRESSHVIAGPRDVRRPLQGLLAEIEVWYLDFCQLWRFGSRGLEKCLVARSPRGFCGYQTSRFAQGRVPNLGSRREKVPNRSVLPRIGLRQVPNRSSCPDANTSGVLSENFGKVQCGRSCPTRFPRQTSPGASRSKRAMISSRLWVSHLR